MPSTCQFHGVFPKWTVFVKAVNALEKYKDAQYMAELFIKVIEDVGVKSCVQIITDNAPVCKDTSMIVEAEHPQVFRFS